MSLADLMRKGSLRALATATPAAVATHMAIDVVTVAEVATVAVAKPPDSFVGGVSSWAADAVRSARVRELEHGNELPEQYAHETAPAADADGFAQRVQRFTERGLVLEMAEALAERLAGRDQECDDRRLCLECSYLGAQGRCIAAATGRLPGASARLEPVQTILQRCEAFAARKGIV